MDADVYHDLDAISRSEIVLINRSPAHYWAAKLDPERKEREPTPAMIAGQILHTCILEPGKFDDQFVVLPADAPNRPTSRQRNAKKPSKATVEAITFWDGWEELHGHKTLIQAEQGEEYRKISAAIHGHSELAPFFEGGKPELTFIADDPVTGLQVRCRPDWMCKIGEKLVVLDFKSCDDARPFPFARSAANYGYFVQAAFYMDVIEWAYRPADHFLIVAFEKKPPYAIKIYEPTDAAIIQASQEYRVALDTIKTCIESHSFPAYPTEIEALDYPHYLQNIDKETGEINE
jgi:hypothetical protein